MTPVKAISRVRSGWHVLCDPGLVSIDAGEHVGGVEGGGGGGGGLGGPAGDAAGRPVSLRSGGGCREALQPTTSPLPVAGT